MEFADRLKKLRQDQEKTQYELAQDVGTSQAAISRLEAGDQNPTYEIIRRLSDALNVSPAYLMGGKVKGEDVEELKPEEEAHFRQLRGLNEEQRKEIQRYMQYVQMRDKMEEEEQEDDEGGASP